MTSIQALLSSLVELPSITPNDCGCQDFLAEKLQALGFTCQRFDNQPVSNLFAYIGTGSPFFLFAGHTDVVTPGDQTQWLTDPFKLIEKNGMLYGRGTADMKGSIAAMLHAVMRFLQDHLTFNGKLGFLITSGEEGNEFDKGTPYVMNHLQQLNQLPNYCLVGEPSSRAQVGDMIKIGRRGSISAEIVFQGRQGHVAYPHLAENPIHTSALALSELMHTQWDEGNEYFPPTSLQITHIHAGGEASNVIPGTLVVNFNIRYSTEQTADGLIQYIESLFSRHQLTPNLFWRLNGAPFLTKKGNLLKACIDIISKKLNKKPELSTSGGTSDGRFIAPYGIEVVELGLVNAHIHQVNECITSDSLTTLEQIYYQILDALFNQY
jgi:succinyl-diaminopimelate desuccinylase